MEARADRPPLSHPQLVHFPRQYRAHDRSSLFLSFPLPVQKIFPSREMNREIFPDFFIRNSKFMCHLGEGLIVFSTLASHPLCPTMGKHLSK